MSEISEPVITHLIMPDQTIVGKCRAHSLIIVRDINILTIKSTIKTISFKKLMKLNGWLMSQTRAVQILGKMEE